MQQQTGGSTGAALETQQGNTNSRNWCEVLLKLIHSTSGPIHLILLVCFTVEPLQKFLHHLQMTVVGSKVHYCPAILRKKHNTHIGTVFGMWHAPRTLFWTAVMRSVSLATRLSAATSPVAAAFRIWLCDCMKESNNQNYVLVIAM